MLLKTGYSLDYTVTVSFFYDNDEIVQRTIATGDIIKASYNKNGKRVSIEGKVTRIYTQDNHAGHIGHVASCSACTNTGCYIVVDGSTFNNSEIARIDVDTLLEVEIIEKGASNNCVTSPVGETNISGVRLSGNWLQITPDHGETWLNVCQLASMEPEVDPAYKGLADKISALIPPCARPDAKQDAVEDLVELFKQEASTLTKDDNDDPQQV